LTATKGPVRIVGNVRGKHNWAYQLARKAEQGAPDMAYFKLTADDAVQAGVFDKQEVEDARSVLPPEAFQELYYAEAADDGSNPFGWDAIQACTVPKNGVDKVGALSVAIAGGPRTGKTTAAGLLGKLGYQVRGTDSLVETHDWSAASEATAEWFGPSGQVIEGVAVARALRKWLKAHPTGKPCDIVLLLDEPQVPRTPKQEAMAKGCRTVWGEIEGDLLGRGVTILSRPTEVEAILASAGTTTLRAEPAICWGWDFARAQDWTVGVALDRNYRVVALERWQRPWKECKEDVTRITNAVPAWGDSTGVGDAIVEDLQRGGCPIIGVPFSRPMKQQLMERLRAALQQKKLKIPEGPITQELESFEYKYRADGGLISYSAPDGLHDDCVMALALAVYGRDQFGDITVPVSGTFEQDRHPGFDYTDKKRRKPWERGETQEAWDSPWLPSPEMERL
jgi:hypothetical protein